MADDLISVLERFGRGAVTVFYTNSRRPEANRPYGEFKERLEAAGFRTVVEEYGRILVARQGRTRERGLWYAAFHRARRRILSLGAT